MKNEDKIEEKLIFTIEYKDVFLDYDNIIRNKKHLAKDKDYTYIEV